MKETKLSTEPYKGVRDFYPADQSVQNYIIDTWKTAVRRFGYEEYNASILEPAELYKAKSGEEIVNEQTYTFTDRGDREVTLRPEMTPTVARMIAARKRDLPMPVRWFSVPNLFRYERPQKGRLREHWQLNVDIFGIDSIEAEIEMISIAASIMRAFRIETDSYEIRVNSRKLMNEMLGSRFGFDEDTAHKLGKLIDRRSKMEGAEFKKEAEILAGDAVGEFLALLDSRDIEEFARKLGGADEAVEEVRKLLQRLDDQGISNAAFDPTLMRGFDYYTGIVFEIFDRSPENKRSLFGGGRYDDLLSIFGSEKVPAVGFGMGDVTIRDVLESRGLLPAPESAADIALCLMDENTSIYAESLAQKLRAEGTRVMIDFSGKSVGDKIKNAGKRNIPFAVVIGEDEVKSKTFKIKQLSTGEEKEVTEENLIDALTAKS